MKESQIFNKAKDIFDKIIEIDNIKDYDVRNLKDGRHLEVVPFKNKSRHSAFHITPYDRTLLIDSDFLIFSDNLSNFWDLDYDIMISKSIFDLANIDRSGYHDKYISDTGVHLYWATTVLFSKTKYAELFFNLVESIKENYQVFSEIYRFDHRLYRNDIAFSIAKHILDGFETDLTGSLPPIPITYDSDILENVSKDGKLTFLISQNGNFYSAMSIVNRDIHIMNKQSIIRNNKKLLELI